MSHVSRAFEKISLSPLFLLHRKSSFLWSLYSQGLRERKREGGREVTDRVTDRQKARGRQERKKENRRDERK